MNTLQLRIVTPEGSLFDGEVESVYLPGVCGELGVLPGHTALMQQLEAGELRITQKGKLTFLAIGRGLAEIQSSTVDVLTEGAIEASQINEDEAQKAVERAQAALQEASLQGDDLEAMEAMLARSLAQLDVKRRRRKN